LSRIDSISKVYESVDYLDNEENSIFQENITIEFLNSLKPNGLPLHKLELKVGSIVMLLRNLNVKAGLCNGTRLIVLSMHKYSLETKVITGSHSGKIVILPRIDLWLITKKFQ